MEVLLNRCDNDIEYAQDCLGFTIGFIYTYRDREGNIYRVYYGAIVDSDDIGKLIENDLWEEVADWYNPDNIYFDVQDDEGSIAIAITKKAKGKRIGYGGNLLDIGCFVTVTERGKQLILNI